MIERVSLPEAQAHLEELVHRAARSRGRVAITDHGEPAAVLISQEELADLDEAVALAQHRSRQASGAVRTVPHDEVRARLGLVPG